MDWPTFAARAAIEPDTIFHMASCGKQLTGIGILMLAEAGRLGLDDPVSRHIPSLAGFDRKVTIRQLLHHTSGIRDFYDESGIEEVLSRCERPANADIIRVYADLGCPMARRGIEPGDEFSYSNSGYDLLGTVIERASGQPYHDFFQQRVFDPLGMKDTFTAPDRRLTDRRLATGYALDGKAISSNSAAATSTIWSARDRFTRPCPTCAATTARWRRMPWSARTACSSR